MDPPLPLITLELFLFYLIFFLGLRGPKPKRKINYTVIPLREVDLDEYAIDLSYTSEGTIIIVNKS